MTPLRLLVLAPGRPPGPTWLDVSELVAAPGWDCLNPAAFAFGRDVPDAAVLTAAAGKADWMRAGWLAARGCPAAVLFDGRAYGRAGRARELGLECVPWTAEGVRRWLTTVRENGRRPGTSGGTKS